MTNEVSVRPASEEKAVLNVPQRLEALAKRANEAHLKVGPVVRYGLLCAYEAGQALLEANRICPVRQWLKWLAANFEASRWTAQRYMQFAKECNQLGGSDGAALHHIAPHEAGGLLKKILVLPSGKKKPKRAVGRPAILPPPEASEASSGVAPLAEPGSIEPGPAARQPAGDPFLRSEELLSELIDILRVVACGDDSCDGPLAETLLTDLQRAYADLVDFIEIRKEENHHPTDESGTTKERSLRDRGKRR